MIHPIIRYCELGRVVTSTLSSSLVGHIIGFGENGINEVIIEVKWCNGSIGLIHPANIKFL